MGSASRRRCSAGKGCRVPPCSPAPGLHGPARGGGGVVCSRLSWAQCPQLVPSSGATSSARFRRRDRAAQPVSSGPTRTRPDPSRAQLRPVWPAAGQLLPHLGAVRNPAVAQPWPRIQHPQVHETPGRSGAHGLRGRGWALARLLESQTLPWALGVRMAWSPRDFSVFRGPDSALPQFTLQMTVLAASTQVLLIAQVRNAQSPRGHTP